MTTESFVSMAPAGLPGVVAPTWGSVTVTADRFTVSNMSGQRLTSLAWKTPEADGHRPIVEFPYFEPVRQMLSQPIISQIPAALGPFLILSDFDKNWDVARLRPLQTAVEVDIAYVPGYDCGRYPSKNWSDGIDTSVLGSYELLAPWRLSLPYPPLFSATR